MHRDFPVFSSHLDLAHLYWERLVEPQDTVIDATCGNGKDTLKLAQLAKEGLVIGMDIQKEAIQKTQELLKENLSSSEQEKVHLFCSSHEEFPAIVQDKEIKLIVYNLGYLPGGNKQLTTLLQTTLQSIQNALAIVAKGGAVSVACYPGHEEGAKELKALLQMASTLDPKVWCVCHHEWQNRTSSPTLLFFQKSK